MGTEKSIQSTYLEQAVFRKFEVITFSVVDSWYYVVVDGDGGRLTEETLNFVLRGLCLRLIHRVKLNQQKRKHLFEL